MTTYLDHIERIHPKVNAIGELGPFYADPAKRARMKPEAQWEISGAAGYTAVDIYKASQARTSWYQAGPDIRGSSLLLQGSGGMHF
jgi:hypothetical protein